MIQKQQLCNSFVTLDLILGNIFSSTVVKLQQCTPLTLINPFLMLYGHVNLCNSMFLRP